MHDHSWSLHDHSWSFTLRSARWTAACRCGPVVTVETPTPGASTWAWTLAGGTPPTDLLLDAIASVQRARRELLATRLVADH